MRELEKYQPVITASWYFPGDYHAVSPHVIEHPYLIIHSGRSVSMCQQKQKDKTGVPQA